LAIYGVPTALVLAVIASLVWSWSGEVAARAARLGRAQENYARAYLGGGERLPDKQALDLARRRELDQQRALDAVEGALVATLPKEFRDTQFNNANGLLRQVLVGLRAQAERGDIALPVALPLEGGFDPDETARSRQLAQLYLVQQTLRLLLDGCQRIDSFELKDAYCDASRRYAVFTCEFRLRADFRTVYAMIRLLADNPHGIGLRTCSLRPMPGSTSQIEFSGSASLLCPIEERWALPVVAGVVAEEPARSGDRPRPPRSTTARGR
jgi:hypothetical protein